MKFLHTSDLHIGKSLHGYSLDEDIRRILERLLEYAKEDKADALIIAGDVFDRALPTVESLSIFSDFLTHLVDSEVHVFIIPGNHDNPERLTFVRRILARNKIYIAPTYDGELFCVKLSDVFGNINIYMAPYMNPGEIEKIFPENGYADIILKANINYEERNIFIGHQYFNAKGVNRVDNTTTDYAIDAKILERFDYAALGHLHREQQAKYNHVRYSGSPLKFSRNEKDYEKFAIFIEIREKNNYSISPKPLIPLRDVKFLRGTLDELLSEGSEDYVYIRLLADAPNARAELKRAYPNMLDLETPQSIIIKNSLKSNLNERGGMNPEELFEIFYEETNGKLNDLQRKMLKEIFNFETS